MAADKQYQFRKGNLSKSSKNPYQDPTYLSFTLIFDTTSPLFNKDVSVSTLKNFYKEEQRADDLQAFIDTFLLINREMPWYWISIEGVDKAFEYNMKDGYRGGDDAELSIACNESINLAITGLMDLYRNAIYDLAAWTQILPENYRKFRMWVVVSEVRDINTERPIRRNMSEDINNDITGDFRPLFNIQFDYCTFNINSAKETFTNLNASAPESPAPTIKIKYETIKIVETSYLHGLMTESIGDQGVEGGKERNGAIRSFGDRLADDLQDIGRSAAGTLRGTFKDAKSWVDGSNNVYGSKLEQVYQQAINDIDGLAGGLARTPRNIYADTETAAKESAKGFKKSLKENIFGENFATVGAALRQGSLNAILPLINKP